MTVAWPDHFRTRRVGQPLKRVALTHVGTTVRGEDTLTNAGIKGGAVYALSSQLHEAIARDGHAMLTIDLRPDVTESELAAHLATPPNGASLSTHLRK